MSLPLNINKPLAAVTNTYKIEINSVDKHPFLKRGKGKNKRELGIRETEDEVREGGKKDVWKKRDKMDN